MFLCAPEAVSPSLKEIPQAQVQRFSLTHICCVILGSEETPGFFFYYYYCSSTLLGTPLPPITLSAWTFTVAACFILGTFAIFSFASHSSGATVMPSGYAAPLRTRAGGNFNEREMKKKRVLLHKTAYRNEDYRRFQFFISPFYRRTVMCAGGG